MYAATTFGLWILMLIGQHFTTLYQKTLKAQEGICNDERMKLVGDMVAGIRTIKTYGWEEHYLAKIKEQRGKQLRLIYKINIISSLGLSVFQNFGLIAVFFIFYP